MNQQQKKKMHSSAASEISLLFFFLSLLLEIYSQVLEIAYCSATFILSLLPKHTSCVSREAAMNRQLFVIILLLFEPLAEQSLPWSLGAENQPTSTRHYRCAQA